MKLILAIFFLFSMVSAINGVQLEEMLISYFDTLEITENTKELINCLFENVIEHWDDFFNTLHSNNKWEPTDVYYLIGIFLDPIMVTLRQISYCSKGEIQQMENLINDLATNMNELMTKLKLKSERIAYEFNQVSDELDEENFPRIGVHLAYITTEAFRE